MNIVFCHGIIPPNEKWEDKVYSPNKGWKDWLQFMVEAEHDVIMQIPKFPHAAMPLMKYDEWAEIMDHQQINSDTVLLGHSAGGGFILKYLSLNPHLRPKQIILVAPWIDAGGAAPFGFYKDFQIDAKLFDRAADGIDLMISDNDIQEMQNSANKIIMDIPKIRVHKFHGFGHFVQPELPEIMKIIKF